MPGHNSKKLEGIFAKFRYGICPFAGQVVIGIFAVVINVDVMPGTFIGYRIPPFVGINCVFAEERDVWLVQNHHLWRQEESSVVFDLLVGEETPAKTLEANQAEGR